MVGAIRDTIRQIDPDVPRAIGGAQRLVQNANEAVDAARQR